MKSFRLSRLLRHARQHADGTYLLIPPSPRALFTKKDVYVFSTYVQNEHGEGWVVMATLAENDEVPLVVAGPNVATTWHAFCLGSRGQLAAGIFAGNERFVTGVYATYDAARQRNHVQLPDPFDVVAAPLSAWEKSTIRPDDAVKIDADLAKLRGHVAAYHAAVNQPTIKETSA